MPAPVRSAITADFANDGRILVAAIDPRFGSAAAGRGISRAEDLFPVEENKSGSLAHRFRDRAARIGRFAQKLTVGGIAEIRECVPRRALRKNNRARNDGLRRQCLNRRVVNRELRSSNRRCSDFAVHPHERAHTIGSAGKLKGPEIKAANHTGDFEDASHRSPIRSCNPNGATNLS